MADQAPPRQVRGPWYRTQTIGTVLRADMDPANPHAFVDPWGESVLEIAPRWSEGLVGIDDFSHLVVSSI
ncbi:MAG: hypothetical protein M3R06_06580 [Chloroflexota bacterium]|nr:hypothetical protein [Chloroflexota bacterium]